MAESSIYQHLGWDNPAGVPHPLGIEVGRRIRDLRCSRGLTQTQLAAPLTKSYLSAVENGRVLPSLRALCFIADRLGVGVGDLVDEVKTPLTDEYTASHGRTRARHDTHPPKGRRRPA